MDTKMCQLHTAECSVEEDNAPSGSDDQVVRTFRLHREANFAFKHAGHCAAGWIDANSQQFRVEACYAQCEGTPECVYFAYDATNGGCALYEDEGCPDDGRYPLHMSYRVIRPQETPSSQEFASVDPAPLIAVAIADCEEDASFVGSCESHGFGNGRTSCGKFEMGPVESGSLEDGSVGENNDGDLFDPLLHCCACGGGVEGSGV